MGIVFWRNGVASLCLWWLSSACVYAQGQVLLILDDMGNKRSDLRALTLPSEVTFSILPGTPYSQHLADEASEQQRDIMLHLPMQAEQDVALGPMAITLDMGSTVVERTLRSAFASVPHVVGVNNHMGSLYTRNLDAMDRFMRLLRPYNVFFIDSRTTAYSVAAQSAEQQDIPVATRHLFLDHFPNRAFIHHQWELLRQLSKTQPLTIVIAHPHQVTLTFLLEKMAERDEEGISLVSAREVFVRHEHLQAKKVDSDEQTPTVSLMLE